MNHKDTNKILGMDLWFEFMKDKPYPQWFWSKAKEDSSKKEFTDKELFELQKKLDLKKDEIDFLIKHHKDEVIEEPCSGSTSTNSKISESKIPKG